jgi:hypothetical protein
MATDMANSDRIARHPGQQRSSFLARQQMQAPVLDVAQTRREPVAEEGHESKYMVRCSARIGVVLLDREAGLVI